MASSSRARKILGLVEQNTSPDGNTKMDENCNDNGKADCKETISIEKNTFTPDGDSKKKDEYCNDNNKADCEELQIINRQSSNNTSRLVPYDSDSDTSMCSKDDDTSINHIKTNENDETVPQSCKTSSSSSSSSDSSSSSSSSSSDSEYETYPPTSNEVDDSNKVDENYENIPPEDQISKRLQDSRICRRLETPNYQISPVYIDESDVDLSDTDPTFINTGPTRKKNYLFNEYSSNSSFESSMAETSPPKIGRKRTKNPSKWKQNIIKRLRNNGKSYVSKSQKKVSARCLKEPCTDKCRLKCVEKINTDDRYKLFCNFWDLGDLVKQRAYIKSCMIDIEPKYKYTNAAQPRNNNKAYNFVLNGTKIRVCKTFFKSTLDITDRMIFTIQTKVNENGIALNDLRGKHKNHRKIDPELRTAIKKHINSIPRIESHYLRASTSREYIEGSKTIKDLYHDFESQQRQKNKEAGTYTTYYKIFTTEFNLGFFAPKKDQCDLCTSYINSNDDQKSVLEENYKTHIEEKDYSRHEKLKDRKKVNKNVRVAVYDLEAVLQCPKGNTSAFYYKSKLNCYNLTITELANKDTKLGYENVHCYFWSECDAKRGAIEIGSCIWEYLKALSEQDDDVKDIIFYSDNCAGQNKNKYITCLYLFAVQNLNIKSITHKFLIRGHTQNEADSVHSLIEKEIQRNLKSGPIYTPDQYIALIKNAKKSKPSLNVHELNFAAFFDLKCLQEDWGYNFSTNTEGQNVNWNDIKVLKMEKVNSTAFFYKTSYKEESYKEVDTRNKRKKMKPISEVTLNAAYTVKQELSQNKKKDLKELLSKSLIPSYYANFYNTIT